MERRLFYTSPVDHHTLNQWPRLAQALVHAVESQCNRDVAVTLGQEPVWGYGTDADEALAVIEERRIAPRQVNIDLWCSICFYATLCVTLGPGIRRRERRALARRLRKKELAGQVLLREHEGPYHLDSGRSYGYSLNPHDDRDRSTIDSLLIPFDPPLYLGERWLLMDENEELDEGAFNLIVSSGSNLGIFLVREKAAEEMIWQSCLSGEGLIAFYPDDPAEKQLLRRFSEIDDLRIFQAEAPSAGARVTIGRCHQDDTLVVVHDPPYAPEIEEPLMFMI